ncbi:MAG: redoxin domain-containing protein [Saprospiraceae bacterium]
MPKLLLSFLMLCLPVLPKAQASAPADTFSVFFFLLEDCKITQAYTDKMQHLYRKFAGDSIQFQGYFPNPISADSTVQAFVAKHKLPFPCTREVAATAAKRFGVTVTPEVVVYNETRQTVVYQGRIDNLYERVGLRRQVVTSHELEAALYCIRHNKPVPIPRTNAVGCFLNLN